MPPIPTLQKLSQRRGRGVACDGDSGLCVGHTPLLLQSVSGASWSVRPAADINDELSRAYGIPIDLGPRARLLAGVAEALNRNNLPVAQIKALHLRLPDPPAPQCDRTELLIRLASAGLLKLEWDEGEHPRWPAGSPDSAGGQFAPAGEIGSQAPQADAVDDAAQRASGDAANQQRTLHFQTTIVDRDGSISGKFLISPPSQLGGVIVQRIVSTDTSGGATVRSPLVGWEAWPIARGAITTGSGAVDDEWKAPPSASPPRPSIPTVTTIVAEARFYEGITMADLARDYGFTKNGSGFSGELMSTQRDPNLLLDHASAPLRRSKSFIAW